MTIAIVVITSFLVLKHRLGQMLLPLALQIEVPWNIRDKPRDKTCDDVDRELKYEHESEATSDHVPVLLVLLVRLCVVKVAMVPEM